MSHAHGRQPKTHKVSPLAKMILLVLLGAIIGLGHLIKKHGFIKTGYIIGLAILYILFISLPIWELLYFKR